MTNHVNMRPGQFKKAKIEELENDTNERVLDTSTCEVSEFKQELIDFMALAQRRTINSVADKVEASNCSATSEDEAMRLKKEVEFTMESVEESGFFQYFVSQLRDDSIIHSNILRVLGPDLRMDMVIYGLGSIQYDYGSQYQLALALLLKRHFPHWIGAVEVYDPLFTSADRLTMEMLGCKALIVNEQCKRRVEKPTIFYLPYLDVDCIGDLLEANWCPARLNKMIIITRCFDVLTERLEEITNEAISDEEELEELTSEAKLEMFLGVSSEYIRAISKHTIQVNLDIPEGYWSMFSWCTWHFFPLDAALDLDILLTGDTSVRARLLQRQLFVDWRKNWWQPKEEDEIHELNSEGSLDLLDLPFKKKSDLSHFILSGKESDPSHWALINLTTRSTRARHCIWDPPSTGWIKLNFSFKGRGSRAGFGGIVHDEHKKCLGVYCGSLGEADPLVASVEALRWGLKYLKMISLATQLVIEGDDLRVIRWLNRGPDPPSRIVTPLSQVFQLLKRVKPVIHHVYELANSLAIELAMKGATLKDHRIWICAKNGTLFCSKSCAA